MRALTTLKVRSIFHQLTSLCGGQFPLMTQPRLVGLFNHDGYGTELQHSQTPFETVMDQTKEKWPTNLEDKWRYFPGILY